VVERPLQGDNRERASEVSDYKDYEVRVNYEGGIYISARNQKEAIKIAKDIMLEETNPDMAKYLIYNVEETILREREVV
jgi:hypothetical protein